jgi:uncharacterized membrane protein YcjF (UPF0283 family)
MYFDWITWSIWLVGFIILIIWILVPAREFRRLLQKRKTEHQSNNQ